MKIEDFSNNDVLKNLSNEELKSKIDKYSDSYEIHSTIYPLFILFDMALIVTDFVFFLELNWIALIISFAFTIIVGMVSHNSDKLSDQLNEALFVLYREKNNRDRIAAGLTSSVSYDAKLSRLENKYQNEQGKYVHHTFITEYNRKTMHEDLQSDEFKKLLTKINEIDTLGVAPTVETLKVAIQNELAGKLAVITFDGKGYVFANNILSHIGDHFVDLVVSNENQVRFIADSERDSVSVDF